jgi:F-type H+-transporting ATPase subunit c
MAIEHAHLVRIAACIGAGFCMGVGSLGPAIAQGFIGGKACESIGRKPESAALIRSTMMMAAVIAETTAIFCLLISVIMLFVVK